MNNIKEAKKLCIERDAKRCRHCGSSENLIVSQLVKRDGKLAWHISNLITLCQDCYNIKEKNKINQNNNRIGVLLCGGRGTRLFPLTYFQNKHTLPIGLTPMIFYPLNTLRKFGVYKTLIILDREGAVQIIKMLGSGKEFGMDISYKIQEGSGGIAEALYLAKDFAKPGNEIVCVLGDNIFDNETIDINVKLDNIDACVFLKEVSNPTAYGVAIVENEIVKEIIEKPKNPVSNLAVVGLYIYNYSVFDVIDKINPSERGELEISSVNDYYAKIGRLGSRVISGYWGDAGGSIQRYAECGLLGAKKAKVSSEEIEIFKSIVFDEK